MLLNRWVRSLASIAAEPSTVIAGAGEAIFKSTDEGATWNEVSMSSAISSLVIDPRDPQVSGTLYAGTESGVYRSTNAGLSWAAFGGPLAGTWITSLSVGDSPRRLHAATANGIYDLEISRGPLDVAAGPSGTSRVLAW